MKNLRIIFTVVAFLVLSASTFAQTYVLGQGGATINNACSGNILDPGGAGDYTNSNNVTQTFCSGTADCIQLTINSFTTEASFDFLRVYDGINNTAEPLLEYAGNTPPSATITSTTASGGCITLNFTSDGSVTNPGFDLGIQCVPCPVAPTVFVLGQGAPTINTCNAIVRDPGGGANYPDNQNVTQTFCSDNGQCVQFAFEQFQTETGADIVRFFDGPSVASPLIDELSGFLVPAPITSSIASGGCLTVQFNSNAFNNNSGFKANLTCVPCPAPAEPYIILGQGGATINTCGATITDPGGALDYPNSSLITQTFCSGDFQCVRFTFDEFETESGVDLVRFYDGPTTASQLLAESSGFAVPNAVTSSTASGGCLTVQFSSNAFTQGAGFRATISCVPCPPPPPPAIILGQGGATVQTCGDILQDPGGLGNYGDDLNITQTICSGNAQCIKLTFTEFQTETALDRLTIYDGPNTSADLLGIFSGFNLPVPISSSTASGGCMTLVFTSNNSFNDIGFQATISCVTCEEPIEIPTGLCGDAQPFCTDAQGGLTFPAATNTTSEFFDPADGSSNICCLGSTPNPAWYFLRIEEAGPIDLLITSGFDVDFACWGPFTEAQWQAGVCAEAMDPNQLCNGGLMIDCSYSGAAVENCNIPNGQVGEYYMLLLTNFSNQVTNINFTQDGGTGSTDCSIFCQVDAPALPTVCDPVTNTYTLSGTIELTNPPTTGTLTLANSSGGFTIFNAPFANSIPYNYINLSSNGNAENLSVVFSDDNTCAAISNYTAPVSCSTCPVTASVSGPACIGQNVTLSATNVAGATYSWTGPNGYTSNVQNPTLTNVDLTMAGVYTVTASNAVNGCSSLASANVFVFDTPLTPVVSNSGPVCEGTPLNLTCPAVPGAIYSWTGPNGFASSLQNPTIAAASAAAGGDYLCTVTVNSCPSLEGTTTAIVNPYPASPVPVSNAPFCAGGDLTISIANVPTATYEWTGPLAYTSTNEDITITAATVANSGNYSVRLLLNGCYSLPANIAVVIHPIPAAPVITSNTPVCENALLQLTGPSPTPIIGTTYNWTGINSFTSTLQSPSIASAQLVNDGDYSLTVTENNCTSAPTTLTMVVIPLPTPNAGLDVTTCSNQPITIGSAAIPGLSYSWTPADVGIETALLNTSNPISLISNLSDIPRIDTYILTVSDQGCSRKDTVNVTTNPQPIASFIVPDPQCFKGNSFDFEADGTYGANATFEWRFGAWASPDTSILENQSGVSFNSTGLQMVSLTITENGCESNTYIAPVTVYKMPVANFTADYFVGCDPKVINFTNLTESDDPIKSRVWDFGNEKTSNLQNPGVLYNDPGVFDVSLTVTTERGCQDVYLIPEMILIHPTPTADFQIDPPLVNIVKPITNFNDLSTGGDEVSYIIIGYDTIFQTNPRVTLPDSGVYDVRQIVTTALGCRDSVVKQVIVELGYKLYLPTAFTPNNDGYNDRFQVYGEDVSEITILIYNRWGQLMYTSYDMDNGWDGKVRLKEEPAPGGVYVYKIKAIHKDGLNTNYEGIVTLLR
jgi:gliding motility-associated-like protein